VATSPTLPILDGLIELARHDGVDVRPTLVRVLADLYVQKRSHTPDEEHRFTELTLWLLASVDVPTRAAVARTLATSDQVPPIVVRRLARDVFEVAEPILRCSPCLTAEDQLAVIRDFGPRYAAAIGERSSPAASNPDRAAKAPPAVGEVAPAGDAAPAPSAVPERPAQASEGVAARSMLQPRIGAPRVPLGEHFLSAGSAERRLLLANLTDGSLSPAEQAFAATTEQAIRELETAAMQRRPDLFVHGLEAYLNIPRAKAEQIVRDETGEPLVVAARAFAFSSDVLLRILLFLNPVIGHSVERVFDLVDLHEKLSAEAALHIVSSWQAEHSREKRTARYQPVLWDDERGGARRTPSDSSRRALEPRAPAARPDERAAGGR
jgi:hypothetical protein